jgi:hypothetical protein
MYNNLQYFFPDEEIFDEILYKQFCENTVNKKIRIQFLGGELHFSA